MPLLISALGITRFAATRKVPTLGTLAGADGAGTGGTGGPKCEVSIRGYIDVSFEICRSAL
jgi:hypothetical protein